MTGFPLDRAYITAENNLAVTDEQAIRQVIARLNRLPALRKFFLQRCGF
jgi:hypothetical protein